MPKKHTFLIAVLSLFWVYCQTCLAQTISKGPFLAGPGKTSISIRWECDTLIEGKVRFGLKKDMLKTQRAALLGEKSEHFFYECKLSNLKPAEKYYYQVDCGGQKSPIAYFRTNPDENAAISFVAMGDSRSNPDVFKAIANQVNQIGPDLIISNGDLVENGGDFQQWQEFYFSVASEVIDHISLLSCLGDHEGDGDNGELFRYFLYPELPVNELWFSFDFGPAHFVALDYRHPHNKKMLKWFENDMATSRARWNFVYMHRPSYDTGGHRSTWGRGVWPELFRKHRIDIVFAGHSHLYERFFPLRPKSKPEAWPVTYITTAGAGAGLYDVVEHPFLAVTKSINHFSYVTISGDTLRLKAYLNDGSILDEFSMIKQGGEYDSNYLALVKPQEELDIYTNFAGAISLTLSSIPLFSEPARAVIHLQPCSNEDNVEFDIRLSNESANYFKMEPVVGILKKNERLEIPIEIFSKSKIEVSRWGDISPVLRLESNYKTPFESVKAIGKVIDYWPDESY